MNNVTFTTFQNVNARTAEPVKEDWPAFVRRFKDPKEYRDKKAMPLLSMCIYGKKRSTHGSLRHSGNIKEVHGCEIDYDGEKVSPERARKRLERAGLKAVIYTTPSHKPDKPRWRALLPLSKPVSVDKRRELVAKANRALNGIVALESFTPSQSFYFGKLRGDDAYRCFATKGKCIDRVKLEPRYPDGKSIGAAGKPMFDETPDDAFFEAFEKGTGRYNAVLALTSREIAKGRDPEKVRKELHKHIRLAEHDGVKPKTTQGENLYEVVNRLVDSAYEKYGKDAAKRKAERRKKASISDINKRREEQAQEDDPDEWVRRVLEGEHDGRVDFSGIKGREIPPQEWAVDRFIPRGVLTLVHGNGGVGKSLVVLTLAACVATGQEVIGRKVEKGPVIFVSAEESKTALEARIQNIILARELDEDDLAKNMTLISQLQGGFPMFNEDKGDNSTSPASGYYKLKALIRRVKPVMVVIENTANVYHANENWRAQVQQFTALLNELAEAERCAVVLIGHDSKVGEYSGSSHWNNGPRHRIHVKRTGIDKPTRVEIAKTNCPVSPGAYFLATWNNGFKTFDLGSVDTISDLEENMHEVLRLLAQAIKDGKKVSAAHKSPYNAHIVLGQYGAFTQQRSKKSILTMVDQLKEKELIATEHRKDGSTGNTLKDVIKLTAKGRATLDELEPDDSPDDELEDLEEDQKFARNRRRKA